MDRHYQHYEKAETWLQPGGSLFTSFETEKLKEGLKFALQYTVQMSSPDNVLVTRAINVTTRYTVSLKLRKCTCNYFFATDILFLPTIATIYYLGRVTIFQIAAIFLIQV